METTTTLTKTELLEKYSHYILKHNQKPVNVFSFCDTIGIEEKEFYKFFANFNVLESEFFIHFFSSTINLINEDETYKTANAKGKLLTFYFTFFEQLSQNRSLVLYLLGNGTSLPTTLKAMEPLKTIFKEYIKSLGISVIDTSIEKIEKYKEKSINEIAWLHLVSTMQFWLKDTSSSFEKTDVFIEKSIDVSFEFTHLEPLKKMLDFGKFLWKEKSFKSK